MKILVTGGCGFIGSFLVDELVRKGLDVTIFDNLDPQIHSNGSPPKYLNRKARFVHGDVRNYDQLKEAVLDADVIFHKAACVGIGQSQYQIRRYVEANIGGTANLLDILVNNRHHVKKMIVAASMSSYGEGNYLCAKCGTVRPQVRTEISIANSQWGPLCPQCRSELTPIPTGENVALNSNSIYALSKRTQEDMVMNIGKAYDIPVVVLRYFNVYGPRQSLSNPYTGVTAIFMSRLKNGHQPVVYEDGLQTRDFVSIHDVVRANMLAWERDEANFQVFNVGSGAPVAIKDVAIVLAQLCGKDVQPTITFRFRKGDVRHCFADTQKSRSVLGLNTEVSFQDGMEELVSWASDAESVDRFEIATRELKERGMF
jgi:dTDP-L-rhamnose 4-epimerase